MNKIILKLLFPLLTLMIVTGCTSAQDTMSKEILNSKTDDSEKLQLKDTTDSRYKVGQVWSYETRLDEKNSYFIVLKVENHPKFGNIVHIAVRGLKLKVPNGSFIESANHFPFAEKAIDRSVIKILKAKTNLPNYEEGYLLWKESFNAGSAGIYTITIAEVIQETENGLNQQ